MDKQIRIGFWKRVSVWFWSWKFLEVKFLKPFSPGLFSHQTHKKFCPLEITFKSSVQIYCLWIFAILNYYYLINGNSVIVKPNYSETRCSLVSRKQTFWDTCSAPNQTDAAFHLSGAVFYNLDGLDCLVDLRMWVCACSLHMREPFLSCTWIKVHVWGPGTCMLVLALLTQPAQFAQVWPPVGCTQTWLILCTVADDIKLGCKDPRTFSFFCRIKGLPCYIWHGFLLPSLLHSVMFHSSVSPVFPPWRRRNFNSKKMGSIVLCIIWKTPCGMNCAILIFIISNADNRIDLSRKDWLADYWR